MRLFLHGRSDTVMLLKRLQQAKTQPISSILLSCWDADDSNKQQVADELYDFLSSFNEEEQQTLEEIILQNCRGDMQELIATILRSSAQKLVIRFDKQQPMIPPSIVQGFADADAAASATSSGPTTRTGSSKLRGLTLRGMTLTPCAMESLVMSLPRILANSLQSFSLSGVFSLHAFEKKGASVLGGGGRGRGKEQDEETIVTDYLVRLLHRLPNIQTFELEHCHIQDMYMARILTALTQSPSSSSPNCRALKLRGNMCDTETFMVLHKWLVKPTCAIEHLDLSWQRQYQHQHQHQQLERNYGAFYTLPVLINAISKNTSLRTLFLSENKLRQDEVCSLARALEVNTTLQNLELKDCHISIGAMTSLAHHMTNFHLKRLDLNGQQRVQNTKKLRSVFFTPLCDNHYMYDLILPDRQTEESKSLSWLLEWNRAGRRILSANDDVNVPEQLWPMVLARADRICRRGYHCHHPNNNVSATSTTTTTTTKPLLKPASSAQRVPQRPQRVAAAERRIPSPTYSLQQRRQDEEQTKKYEDRATRHGASIIFHLLSQKGYHAISTN